MKKAVLRNIFKEKRNQFPSEEVDAQSIEIANQLLKLPIWEHTYYHLFLSIVENKEVQTEFILHILHAKDKEIVVSKSNFKTVSMTNYLLTDNTKIKINSYNIPEPVDGIEVPHNKIDVVFIPLLTYDKNGNRVGYGAGFYDNMLANCKPNCIKIGLSFFDAVPNISDVYENDIPLNYCVTPKQIYKF